jgi:hypothetical protein
VSPTWDDLEPLLDRLERLGDPAVREDARALVGLLMRLHAGALTRLVEIARQSGHAALLDVWKDDPQVGRLLLLHELHPDDLASRVRQALAEVAPVAAFLGAEVAVLEVSEGEVSLRLSAEAGVPPETLGEFRQRVEAAIVNAAPEVRAVRFAGGPRRLGLPLLSPPRGPEL